MRKNSRVRVRTEELLLPTYLPEAPDKNPMFLENRVYQGSSGRLYPLPFTDRIAEAKTEVAWKAVWLENEFLRVLVLPELGGRIHALEDKTNGYDLIYRQPVIKPALVGLAGPWISGGIEFNWPQHHRPATFLPVDFSIEEHPDGSKTVWCSDHDPMARMKGMHGACLHPGKAYLELKVRAYNRTPLTQTFLWWANVATRVHEAYQSFFPPDVSYVADHAKRAMSEYPLCQGRYYGVNYGERGRKGVPETERPRQFVPPHCLPKAVVNFAMNSLTTGNAPLPTYTPNDLSFYADIPTPCSYMCMGSQQDFFGGYDYFRQAGLVHIANHHISPGKKQWTWGNHEFGYAWDRNLTEPDQQDQYGPYIELMAGVYTDNQPDFSFLQPGETKTWSQYWYPIQKIGPPQLANLDAAVSLVVEPKEIRLGANVSSVFPGATIRLKARNTVREWKRALAPGKPFFMRLPQPKKRWKETECLLSIVSQNGSELVSHRPQRSPKRVVLPAATAPAAPADIASTDELYFIGLHLEQYRHATRCPTQYWREALQRDPGDARCNNALGLWHLRRGEFMLAEACFRKAIERITRLNPNPYDGEPYYNLGLCLRYQARDLEAYAALYKATWNQAWHAAGFHALAELDCRRQDWPKALEHLNRSLRCDCDNTRARDLKVVVLQRLSRGAEAATLLRETLALDPLDWWARKLAGDPVACDVQARLDIVHDHARAGLYAEALDWLEISDQVHEKSDRPPLRASSRLPSQDWGTAPLVHYAKGWLHQKLGDHKAALNCFRAAAKQSPDYCFPARLEEIAILEAAMIALPSDALSPYFLGNLLYDRRRHDEAIGLWERSAKRASHY
jgi:tetratricopeptide (TPR) repeat protein